MDAGELPDEGRRSEKVAQAELLHRHWDIARASARGGSRRKTLGQQVAMQLTEFREAGYHDLNWLAHSMVDIRIVARDIQTQFLC